MPKPLIIASLYRCNPLLTWEPCCFANPIYLTRPTVANMQWELLRGGVVARADVAGQYGPRKAVGDDSPPTYILVCISARLSRAYEKRTG